jgi:hypothetical protein
VTPRRVFLLAFAGYFLAAAAWALALPVNGTYDESRHILRAYAVFDGQWLPHGAGGLSFEVPVTLLPDNVDCTWLPRSDPKPASCQETPTGSGDVDTESYVARYNPVYYLAVGLPLKLWPDGTGLLLARLLSALLSALALGAAAGVAAALRNRLLVAAVALVATPTVVNLAGSVNPNGLEISAAVLLFVALLALVSGNDGAPSRRVLLTLAGAGAFALLTLRHVGPALLVVDLLAVAVLAGAARVRAEARRRDTWSLLGGFAAAGVVVAGGWMLVARSPVGAGTGLDLSTGQMLRELVTDRFEFYLTQIVGRFGYGETTMSPLAVLWWYALVAVAVLPALWRATWRVRGVVAGLVVAGFALLVGFEFLFIRGHGWFSHGRYALPILVGAVLVAVWADVTASGPAWLRGRSEATEERPRLGGPEARASGASANIVARWLPLILVAATAPVHLYALVRVLSRYRVGIDSSLDPFGGSWEPPAGSVVPLLILLAGVGLLTATLWFRAVATNSRGEGTDNRPSTRTVSAN